MDGNEEQLQDSGNYLSTLQFTLETALLRNGTWAYKETIFKWTPERAWEQVMLLDMIQADFSG